MHEGGSDLAQVETVAGSEAMTESLLVLAAALERKAPRAIRENPKAVSRERSADRLRATGD